MDRRYSPITDMYGAAPEWRPPRHKSRTWLYVFLTLAGFFVLESIQPVMRLRSHPPPSVTGAALRGGEASQAQTARACWDYAITWVQGAYPYGTDLPRNPPRVLVSKSGRASAISVICWPRLRNAWSRPESWVRSYEWNTDWLTSPDGVLQRTLVKVLNWFGIRSW